MSILPALRLVSDILLALVLFQISVALQPARHYWRYLDNLALTTSFGGYNKQPWLYVELPVFGGGAEGKETDFQIPPRNDRYAKKYPKNFVFACFRFSHRLNDRTWWETVP